VDGTIVWSANMRAGDVANLSGVPAQPIFGDNALISLWERDTGHIGNPDDLLGEFFAEYTGGTQRTQTINYHNGTAVYEITYVVNRPEPKPQCSDGKDNDGDGKIDFGTGANNDPGCESASDNDESNSPPRNTPPTIDPP
jgi:hypothetical protein